MMDQEEIHRLPIQLMNVNSYPSQDGDPVLHRLVIYRGKGSDHKKDKWWISHIDLGSKEDLNKIYHMIGRYIRDEQQRADVKEKAKAEA